MEKSTSENLPLVWLSLLTAATTRRPARAKDVGGKEKAVTDN